MTPWLRSSIRLRAWIILLRWLIWYTTLQPHLWFLPQNIQIVYRTVQITNALAVVLTIVIVIADVHVSVAGTTVRLIYKWAAWPLLAHRVKVLWLNVTSKTVRSLLKHIVATFYRFILEELVRWHLMLLHSPNVGVRAHSHVADLLIKLVDVSAPDLHLMCVSLLLHVNILVLCCARKATEPATLLLLRLFLLVLLHILILPT